MMHEYGLCEGIVDAAQQRAAGRPVARVRVRVGVLYQVVTEAFQQAFTHAASGTEVENAAVDLVVIPIQAVCRMCKANVESTDVIVMCPTCGGVDLDLTTGDELILESIEYDDPTARRQ
jgi:hydrogenase nickel incorporation protein HypA/HybF